jgi:hypothetical protein
MDGDPPRPDSTADNDKVAIPTCCCGCLDCPFLAHSNKLLNEVERDAQKAGELGQVRPN